MKRVVVIAVLIAAASSLALSQTETKKPDPSKPIGEKVGEKAVEKVDKVTEKAGEKVTEKAVEKVDKVGEKVAATVSPEQAVKQLFDELVASYAKNDAAAPTRILADDFTFTNPFGEVMTKEQRIGEMKPGGIQFDSYTVDDVKVRVYGDTAVVTNQATLSGKRGDQVLSGQYRATSVFVKKGGAWQVVASQSTRIPDKPTP